MPEEKMVNNWGYVKLINQMGNDTTIVNAARVSFNKQIIEMKHKDIQLLNYLIEHNHTSPLEHVVFTFEIKCPLFIRSQIMRHRSFSYNEVSRRYTDDDIEFYCPNLFRKQSKDNRQASTGELINPTMHFHHTTSEIVEDYQKEALSIYNEMLENGIAKEQARMVLPQSMMTKFYMTGNLHNWLHFVKLRLHKGAQWEVQQIAEDILNSLEDYVPETIQSVRRIKKW